jgi:hypothetical protein
VSQDAHTAYLFLEEAVHVGGFQRVTTWRPGD